MTNPPINYYKKEYETALESQKKALNKIKKRLNEQLIIINKKENSF